MITGILPVREIVIAQSPLGYGNGIVLRSNAAPVIEQRNATAIKGTVVCCLRFKAHVVLAQLVQRGVLVDRGSIVPELKLAPGRRQIGRQNPPIILEPRSDAHV